MLAVLAAVLALAGAPAATSFVCQPSPPLSAQFGRVDGLAHLDETPARIEVYGPLGCAALWYAGASTAERRQLERLNARRIEPSNPASAFPEIVGFGLLIDAHEAFHVGLASTDECQVEKAALAAMPGLLARFFDPAFAAQALRYAAQFDAALGPAYHSC